MNGAKHRTNELRRIRILIVIFMILLVLSGLTAFAVEWQLSIFMEHPQLAPAFYREWLTQVYTGVHTTNQHYPFIAYGTDWLAFAHIVIAIAFIGPLRDPVKNIWVLQFGMISCVLVIPLALIAGSVRSIPFSWQVLDCSFGILGFIPLYICFRKILRLGQRSDV